MIRTSDASRDFKSDKKNKLIVWMSAQVTMKKFHDKYTTGNPDCHRFLKSLST